LELNQIMKAREFISEAWSQKYKSSINCSHPKDSANGHIVPARKNTTNQSKWK